jgi:hypothetical protein
METVSTFETSANFNQMSRLNIPEDIYLQVIYCLLRMKFDT